MSKDFLGRGWSFPIRVNYRGNVELTEFEKNIEQSIHIILGTPVGERAMRPDFGCRIHDFIFYPNNASTASIVSYYTRESLVKWEPRISGIKVEAYPDIVRENVLLIDITYRVPTDNSIRNMVYPFYLRREQDL
jgi:hypothetical protein